MNHSPMPNPPDDTDELRQEAIDACLTLRAWGHFVGTWGNIGVRVQQGLLVTPTRLDYSVMRPADLVVVSWNGERLKGTRLPSSEMELHRQVLLRRADMQAVVHTHSPYATCLAVAGRALPVCVEDMAQIVGGTVHCSKYVRGGMHAELAAAACEALGDESFAALLANHGAIVGGRNLAEAVVASQILEKAAMAFLFARGLGGAITLPVEAAAAERDRFLHKYGTAADQAETS